MKKLAFIFLSFLISSLAFAQEEYLRNNILIVFDASGSMGEYLSKNERVIKIDTAKESLAKVLENVDGNTNVGILVFGSVYTDYIYELGPVDKKKISKVIGEIGAGGGTPLGKYMEKAANILLAQRDKQFGYGSYKVLVVTDGEASDSGLMRRVAPETIRRGISIDVIGVGMNQEHELAKMSSSYTAANDTASLLKALNKIVLAETGNANIDSKDFNLINPLTEEQAKELLSNLNTTNNKELFAKIEQSSQNSIAQSNNSKNNQTSNGLNPALGGFILFCFFMFLLFKIFNT